MKKLYKASLFQVAKSKGYIKECEPYWEIKGLTPVFTAESGTLVERHELKTHFVQEIIVEKISPYMVREVKTGLTFPILNIRLVDDIDNPYRKEEYGFCVGNIHTYVLDECFGHELEEVSVEDLEEYNQKHPDASEFKKELLTIFTISEENMKAKLFQEAEFEQIYGNNSEEAPLRPSFSNTIIQSLQTGAKKRRKIRQLKRQFRQERKNI